MNQAPLCQYRHTVKSRYKQPPWDRGEGSYTGRFLISRDIFPGGAGAQLLISRGFLYRDFTIKDTAMGI